MAEQAQTTNEDIAAQLQAHPFLAGLSDRHLRILADCAREVRFEAGTLIAREGSEADAFYLITRGRLQLEIHVPGRGPVPVQMVTDDGVLGWSWLSTPHRWMFDARTLSAVRAITFEAGCLRGLLEADYELGYRVMGKVLTVMAERLNESRVQMLDLYAPPTK